MIDLITKRYRVLEILGQGSMGIVYRAHDRLTNSVVALKKIHIPAYQLDFATQVADPKPEHSLDSLTREFQTLASLRHPYIIHVLDFALDEAQQPFFTMEYLANSQNLRQYSRGKDHDEIIRCLLQVLEALAYLHRQGIIHRDLKPDNILVADQQARVLDFGLSIKRHEQADLSGTLAYMAPETLQHGITVEASDLYAVGVMAYELICGQLPFELGDFQGLLSEQPDMSLLDVPMELSLIIQRLLLKQPEDRYTSANQAADALRRVVGITLGADETAIRESYLRAGRFVGRGEEVQRLSVALQEAANGKGSAWLVQGESGVGKSRLLDEIRVQALVKGAWVMRGQAFEGGGLSYQVWRNILPELILRVDLSPDEASILQDIVPEMDRLVEQTVMPAPTLIGQAYQERLILTIYDLFKRAVHPILLILEDLQWSNESLAILEHLLRTIGDLPLLILGSYRTDESPKIPEALHAMQSIMLPRFNPDAIGELSESMLGEAGRQDHVVKFLEKETEGNVFFLVEVVRALAEESGQLASVGRMTLPNHVFTGGVDRIIQRRLTRVPAWGQELLQLAAVQGRYLDLALLEKTDRVPAMGIASWLDNCVNAAVIEAADGKWRFSHDKLRESLLANLSQNQLVQFHQRIAESIEALYNDQLDTYAPVLAKHWAAANHPEKESAYLLTAGEQLKNGGSYIDALRQFERALHIQSYQYHAQPRHAEAGLYNKIGNIYQLRGMDNEGERWQNKALTLYRDLNDLAGIREALSELGDIELRRGHYDSARTYFEKSLALSRQIGAVKQEAYDLMNLGNLAQLENDIPQSLTLREESLVKMRQAGEPVDIARALNNLALTHDLMGNFDRALEVHHEALDLRRQLNDPMGIAYSLANMGALYNELGKYHPAESMITEAIALLRQIGNMFGLIKALSMIGDVALNTNDLQTAYSYYVECLQLSRETENRYDEALALGKLGEIVQREGNFSQTMQFFQQSLVLRIELGLPLFQIGLLSKIADFLAEIDSFSHALLILAFIRHHQKYASTVKNIEARLQSIQHKLPPQKAEAIIKEAEENSLEALVQRVQGFISAAVN